MRAIRYISCLALILCACTTTTTTESQKKTADLARTTPSDNDAAVCEVMYAAYPHEKAVAAIGEQRLKQTQSFDFNEMRVFSKAFMPTTQAIAEDVARSSGESLRILGQKIVLGGYEGASLPSVVIRTAVRGKVGYTALVKMAAHIGYIYAQDSTLVICADEPVENWQNVTSLEVTDNGEEEFLNEDNVPLFFGMMIGAFNGPERLGYTFYKESKTFSTLAASDRSPGEYAVVKQLSDWLTELSNGDVELAISTRSLWIFFPHNDWQENPEGQAYFNYMERGLENRLLAQRRQQYLDDIDKFLSQRNPSESSRH